MNSLIPIISVAGLGAVKIRSVELRSRQLGCRLP